MPTPYHHTYVMKLFDRSVDLAKFEEDTPLYPICRAWMQNQPRNPQVVVKYVKFPNIQLPSLLLLKGHSNIANNGTLWKHFHAVNDIVKPKRKFYNSLIF